MKNLFKNIRGNLTNIKNKEVKEFEIDKYPWVQTLKGLYEAYEKMEFSNKNPFESAKKDLECLIEYISKDEKLKALAILHPDEKIIYLKGEDFDSELGFPYRVKAVRINKQGLYIGWGSGKKEKEIILDYFPDKINANKLKNGILDYIQKALYTPCD